MNPPCKRCGHATFGAYQWCPECGSEQVDVGYLPTVEAPDDRVRRRCTRCATGYTPMPHLLFCMRCRFELKEART